MGTNISNDGLERDVDGHVKKSDSSSPRLSQSDNLKMVAVHCRRCKGPETHLVKQTIKGPGHWHCNACCLVLKQEAIAWLAANPELPDPPPAAGSSNVLFGGFLDSVTRDTYKRQAAWSADDS